MITTGKSGEARFTAEQFTRHQDTMNDLLSFANVRLGACNSFDPPIESTEQALYGLRIGLDVWESHSSLEQYLGKKGKPRFEHADRNTAAQWRHSLRGPFYIRNRSGHRAEFLYEGTLFEVWSMKRTWNDMIRQVPDVVYTTLLPFDGCIVSDGFLLNHGCSPYGPGTRRLAREHARAKKKGLVKSADEFCQVVERLNENRGRGLMEVNNAMLFMDYVNQVNDLCGAACRPYSIPVREIPEELRGANVLPPYL